ncbi:MAG: hypothetical protein ACLFP2_00230 [Candidatus Woesearchaeota archaeon]
MQLIETFKTFMGLTKPEYLDGKEIEWEREVPDEFESFLIELDVIAQRQIISEVVLNHFKPDDMLTIYDQYEWILFKELLANEGILFEEEFLKKLPLLKTDQILERAIQGLQDSEIIKLHKFGKRRLIALNKEFVREVLEA